MPMYLKTCGRWMVIGAIMAVLSACQSFTPKAPGLPQPQWAQLQQQHRDYVRQDQVDVRWRSKQFSFLLYQRQQGEALQMVALTLTGQQLFDVDYDGRRVIVKQRIDEMRLLPFEFLVRDILVATYPDFTKQSNATITVKPTATGQDVYIQNQKVLNLRHSSDTIDLDNIQVPYHMTFSSIENTLESN
ncbi:DUF3261 domain-containing protein [Acinetobacter soli]|uniref:DUF3261 domain-containing protein n=1 Tax=Acinetobacter soli TaxID=487316 RepID=UPI000F65FE7D|nr:DUF3261 domain-containing protein [Acinetobacter soli]RSB57587.1 DUF3261 domain-containing protein [Acinetobacter soli]WOQ36853.1 DUF3261 domain-containing protein [Acinetobacter soli]